MIVNINYCDFNKITIIVRDCNIITITISSL